MAHRIRTGDPRGFNKGHSSKFREASWVRQTPEEGRRTYRQKPCGNNNKDEDNSPKTLNNKNHQASSQKFWQLIKVCYIRNFVSISSHIQSAYSSQELNHLNTEQAPWYLEIHKSSCYSLAPRFMVRGAFNMFLDFFVQAFKIVVDSWKFTVIPIHLMRWLTNFYDFRFKWTATAAIGIHPTKTWLSQLGNFKNAIWHFRRTICNKILF